MEKQKVGLFPVKLLSGFLALTMLTASSGCGKENSRKETQGSESTMNTTDSDIRQEEILLYYSFDEESGTTVYDGSGKGLDAEYEYILNDPVYLKTAPGPQRKPKSAIAGNCLSFDGYTSVIEVEDFTCTGDKLTVDVFAAPRYFEHDSAGSAFTESEIVTAILANGDRTKKQGFVLGFLEYGRITFQIGLGDRWISVYSEVCAERYEWCHITAVFNGTEGYLALYVNGEESGRVFFEPGELVMPEDSLYVAKNPDYKRLIGGTVYERGKFGGLLDELTVYDGALSAEEVASRHASFCQNDVLPSARFEDVWLDSELLEDDPYKPTTHATPPQNWMNESHGLFWYNGYYHLFYQFNPVGPYWGQIVWGHWVSEDLVNWMNVKEAVVSTLSGAVTDGVWSGDASYDADGNPVLFVTAGNDSETLSKQNVACARPKDLTDPYLIEWEVDEKAVVKQTESQGTLGDFRDPQVFRDGDTWYMLVGGKQKNGARGTAYVYTTTDGTLQHWEYRGELYSVSWEGRPWYDDKYGTTWELPNLLPLNYENGESSGKYIFAFIACGGDAVSDFYYWIGEFDKETCRFTPDFKEARILDLGKQVYATARMNYDIHTGRLLINSALSSQRNEKLLYLAGWANCLGYIREICLSEDGNALWVKRIEELDLLLGDTVTEGEGLTADSLNGKLSGIQSDTLYIKLTVKPTDGNRNFRLKYKIDDSGHYGELSYDFDTQTITADTLQGGSPVVNRVVSGIAPTEEDGTLTLEIFIDRSITEIYISGKTAMAVCMYNEGKGLSFLSDCKEAIFDLTVRELIPIKRTLPQNDSE